MTSWSPIVMRLVRGFVQCCLQYNTSFIAEHMPGMRINIANALSHFQRDHFRDLALDAKQEVEAITSITSTSLHL